MGIFSRNNNTERGELGRRAQRHLEAEAKHGAPWIKDKAKEAQRQAISKDRAAKHQARHQRNNFREW